MIQSTSPVAASRRWVRRNAGRMRPRSRCSMPPFLSQIPNTTKPPPAVTIQKRAQPSSFLLVQYSHAVDEDDRAPEPPPDGERDEAGEREDEPTGRDVAVAV